MQNKLKFTLIENPHLNIPTYRLDGTPYVFFDRNLRDIDKWKSFELRSDDIFITSFPKSGTNLMNEIVAAIVNGCDFDAMNSVPYLERSPFLEFPEAGVEFINQMKNQRIIKTHIPLSLLPTNIVNLAKVIYVIRNPKDVLVSYFNFMKDLKYVCYSGTIEDFIEETMDNRIPSGPSPTHIDEYWNAHGVLKVFYEDLITHKFNEIQRICRFLGKQIDNESIRRIMAWSTFNNMKSNLKIQEYFNEFLKTPGSFFRKGEIGDWINYFTAETSTKFDEYIKTNFNKNLKFNYGFTDGEIKAFYSRQNARKASCDDNVEEKKT